MKKIGFIGGLLGVAALVVAAAVPAQAAPTSQAFSDEVVDSLDTFWESTGVAADDRAALVEGIEHGIVPLSLRSGAVPTSTETGQVGIFQRTTETYADGSVRIADLQTVPGVVADRSDFGNTSAAGDAGDVAARTDIVNCQITSGSGFSNADNCLVRGGGGLVTNFFYAGYTLVQGAYNDKLNYTSNPGQTCIFPYSCSIPSRSSFVGNETNWTNAGATYTGTANTAITSQTTYLSIEVGNNSAWPIWTMP